MVVAERKRSVFAYIGNPYISIKRPSLETVSSASRRIDREVFRAKRLLALCDSITRTPELCASKVGANRWGCENKSGDD
jgi:hypothetical protein